MAAGRENDPKCRTHIGELKMHSFIVGCGLDRKLAILGRNKLTDRQAGKQNTQRSMKVSRRQRRTTDTEKHRP